MKLPGRAAGSARHDLDAPCRPLATVPAWPASARRIPNWTHCAPRASKRPQRKPAIVGSIRPDTLLSATPDMVTVCSRPIGRRRAHSARSVWAGPHSAAISCRTYWVDLRCHWGRTRPRRPTPSPNAVPVPEKTIHYDAMLTGAAPAALAGAAGPARLWVQAYVRRAHASSSRRYRLAGDLQNNI